MKIDILVKIHEVAGAILKVVEDGRAGGLTVQNAFDHPDVIALRDQLLGLVLRDDEGLEAAQDAIEEEFDRLHILPSWSDETLAKMGALAAAARALSFDRLHRTSDSAQIFAYTVEKVWPYLEALVRTGILVAQVVA